MVGDGATENNIWPLPKFYFSTDPDFKKVHGSFEKAEGLPQTIASPSDIAKIEQLDRPLPGGAVTLRSGRIKEGLSFMSWVDRAKNASDKKGSVYIHQVGEKGKPIRTFELKKAYPQQVSLAKTTHSDGNEVAVDTIEIAHEQLIITNG